MATGSSSEDERRRAQRLVLEMPVKGRVGDSDHLDLEVVDISQGGMQIRCPDFEELKESLGAGRNVARFEIHITARLAWAQPGDDGEFLTGWEFDGADGEKLIG
jgi:hypothetical protein